VFPKEGERVKNPFAVSSRVAEQWTVKHSPKSLGEFANQEEALKELKRFVTTYEKGGRRKAALLYGPPGTGKTCSAYALAAELGFEVVEINASDQRNKEGVENALGVASKQQSLFFKNKILLVEDVDGFSGSQDRGGVQALLRVIEKSRYPVVMTANDPFIDKLKTLRKKAVLIEFKALSSKDVYQRLRLIALREGVEFEEAALRAIAANSKGDLRAAINDLQVLSGSGKVSAKDVEGLGERERKTGILQALNMVFKTRDAAIARKAYQDLEVDLGELFLWAEQNIPVAYKEAEALSKAYEELALADVYHGRINKWQHYRFYVYCYDLLSAGIALAKKSRPEGFLKLERNTRPLKAWIANNRFALKKSIASKLAEKTHSSLRTAVQAVPLLRVAARSEEFLKGLEEYLELDQAESEWLKK